PTPLDEEHGTAVLELDRRRDDQPGRCTHDKCDDSEKAIQNALDDVFTSPAAQTWRDRHRLALAPGRLGSRNVEDDLVERALRLVADKVLNLPNIRDPLLHVFTAVPVG